MAGARTIVVTGAASGIGAAAAALLKADGDVVFGIDIKEPPATGIDQFVFVDQADSASIDAAVSKIPGGVDGLVNCAGVPPGPDYPPELVLKTNFFGLREFTTKLLGKFSRGGAIVNLTSGTGMGWRQNIPLLRQALSIDDMSEVADFVRQHKIHNSGVTNLSAYPLSKQLLIVWTAAAYPLWQQTGVRMNAIAPGAVATPILGDFMASFGEASAERIRAIGTASGDDVARIVRLLLDPTLDWINGATIPAERGAITFGGLAKLGLG